MNIKGHKLLKQILKTLHDVDEMNCDCDHRIHYTIQHKNNNIILSEIHTSRWYDDGFEIYENCWDNEIKKIKCDINDYIQLLNKYIEVIGHPCGDQILDYEYYHITNDIEFI